MFDTIADMLRGSAPDDLAHALGTDRTQTRRAMEIGLPALITGLRDKTLEPGGALNLASMLDEPGAAVPENLDGYLAAGDPAQGAAMLDVAFGDRGEPALAALSSASGLSTRLLAQVMSVLAPLATGVVGAHAERSPDGLRSYLSDAVDDLEGKGFGRVVELVSPDLPLGGDLDDAIVPDLMPSDLDDDDHLGDNVVEGAFPDLDDAVLLDEPGDLVDDLNLVDEVDTDLNLVDDLPGADDLTEGLVGDNNVDLDLDLDAGEPTETLADLADLDADIGGTVMSPMADLPDAEVKIADPTPADLARDELDLEGKGMSGIGWLWWLIAAVLGIALLLFAVSRCGNDDPEVAEPGAVDTTETAVSEPTPDPAVAARQAQLDEILVDYPNVTGEVIGEVAVLNGTVANETERALLDQTVRAAGLGAQNNVTAVEQPATDGAQGYTLNDVIDVQPELSTLRALLDQAGLGEALSGGSGFTLFAPTNDAFAALPAADLAALQDDPDALQDVLRYHLLVGAQDAATVSASPSLVTQLDGQEVTVDASSGTVVLNGNVSVLAADVTASNGVMHIVNGVLLPASAAAVPEELGAELSLAPITFAPSSSDLTAAGQTELDKVVAYLQANPINIEIGGHTDSDGGEDLNLRLSQDRADAVKTYLTDQGIPADSLTAVGFGETNPIVDNDTPENKAANRRIEFRPAG